ncbi:MAG TPA: hypothetical protein VK502_02045 [Candidatus Saccharimonadales bacterium]|nr:hypothetical protein [Candidatus Saccharimonadales bacterium]
MAEVPIRNNLVLELHVPSFQLVRDFYGKLDFKETTYDPTSGGGSDLGYLVMRRCDEIGDTTLNFYGDKENVSKHAYFVDFPTDTPRGYGVEITVPVSDVEGLWRNVSDTFDKQAISQPLTLKRWGKRDFRVIDPFGFYVRFTEIVDWGQA